MQNLMSDISFEWLLEFLLTMFFLCKTPFTLKRQVSQGCTRSFVSNRTYMFCINYTLCSELLYVFVGDIPLHIDIREAADSGKPIIVSQPDCLQVQCTTPYIVLQTAPSKFNLDIKERNKTKET